MNDEELIKAKMQQEMAQRQEEEAKKILKDTSAKILDRKAYERLSNLKTVKPEVATQIELYLAQLYQAGQIKQIITEEQFIALLRQLTAKPEFNIKRK